MKKLIIAVLAFAALSTTTFAQTTPAKAKAGSQKTTVKHTTNSVAISPAIPAKQTKTVSTDSKKVATKPAVVTNAGITAKPPVTMKPTAPANNSLLKKDGTPDMRYKTNKTSVPKGPAKKDGTPDMRYKANKGKAKN